MLAQPATLQPYLYVVNNPVLLTDPSGEIAPLLLLGLAGGAIGGGIYGYEAQVAHNLEQGLCFWKALSARNSTHACFQLGQNLPIPVRLITGRSWVRYLNLGR